MIFNDISQRISAQIERDQPFVIYSSFGQHSFKALFQKNANSYTVNDYTESGFVLAPFDSNQNTYLIPNDNSEALNFKMDYFEQKRFSYTTSTPDADGHIKMVNEAINYIKTSELKKIVLARHSILNFDNIDICSLFFSISKAYPEAYTYCWFHPKTGFWLGASPETLLSVSNKLVKTMALAGTKTYNGTLEVDWDDKNFEEQAFVTDYLRQSLSGYLHSLKVSKPKTIRAGKLVHLQTLITGQLNDSQNSLGLLISNIHPTPAVCGTPKSLSKKFILQNESINRSFYSGFLGHINDTSTESTPSTHLVVNLRCMHIKNATATLFAGGGITSKSDPKIEWNETEVKIQTLKSIF